MNKRGQLYILVALIIGFIIYVLLTPSNIVRTSIEESDFEELSKNYELESAKLINEVISQNQNIKDIFRNFTILFTSYSKTKNPDFELVYAFIFNETLFLGNYLETGDRIKFNYTGISTPIYLYGCFGDVPVSISIAGLSLSISGVDMSNIAQCTFSGKINPFDTKKLLDFEIENVRYEVELSTNSPEIIIVTKEQQGKDRKVYAKGKFNKGISMI